MMKGKQSPSAGSFYNEFSGHATGRAMAISAGELSVVVRREVKRILESNKKDLIRSLNAGLGDLRQKDLVSDKEKDQLIEICRYLVGSIRGKEDGEGAFFAIRSIYHQMIMDQEASPAALAVASVATSAFNLERSSPLTITPESTGAGAVAGAMIGAGIGFVAGGGLGAGIGAAIGGAAGAAIGLCNEAGV